MIAIVNYGLGNLGSIQNMLKKVGATNVEIAETPDQLERASKIILPGVGAFDSGMQRLKEANWIEILNKKVLIEKVPVLGICLGMQLMTNSSEEGNLPGLGWINAEVIKFRFEKDTRLKVPHMGWNIVSTAKPSSLISMSEEEKRFYFVHSYYVRAAEQSDVLLETEYGLKFVSAFEKDNILGVQFHPEKSHKFGMALFRNFITLY